MKKYRHSFIVNAPLAAVAEFHKDTSALRDDAWVETEPVLKDPKAIYGG